MAVNVEKIIRNNDAIPATIGFVRGVPKVGLSQQDLEFLADSRSPRHKISRRDIAYIMSEQLTGGTTIAATMILAHRAGIDVFATGGLGGVSRPFELMDVSADLDELSKTPVSVVCSGPKSILDVERTMEYLETKGVPVFTFDDGHFAGGPQRSLNVPGFYTRDSGVSSPFVFNDYKNAAKVIYNGKYSMEMCNGYVFCIPAPEEVALPDKFISEVIHDSLEEAQRLGVRGKRLTPFLLERINQKTDGASVKCNIAFVKNNAAIGAKIAKELAYIKAGSSSSTPTSITPTSVESKSKPLDHPNAAVVGSISLDSTSVIKAERGPIMGDSNPGRTFQSVGGVGFNVALAFKVSSKEHTPLLFISAVNSKDSAGKSVSESMERYGLSKEGLCELDDDRTAQYTSVHDAVGRLIVACADMDIVEHLPEEHVSRLLDEYKPTYILMDSNISVSVMNSIAKYASESANTKLLYEPTSAVKAYKLGGTNLHCFPNNEVSLVTPTVAELETMFDSFGQNGKFDNIDSWFTVLDSLNLDLLREQAERCANRFQLLSDYAEQGVLQQAFRLLPYIPNILLKDGANGILLIQLTTNAVEAKMLVDPYSFNLKADSAASFTLVQEGKDNLGVILQHFPGFTVPPEEIKNVTGAGDSLAGYLLSRLANGERKGRFFLNDLADPEREDVIMSAQKVACLSLLSDNAVNIDEIRRLKEDD
ncbi:DEKNAAC102788 [Brettanomyces naardenensis]|uniref:DEKNAAC102788 n=1 Tax=Brettanomyces naardenensis TaxID=13370 RepID=A0A448YKW7_BRENA|nr:DEKNAAC102788 [Brettanomyces naardenensis]